VNKAHSEWRLSGIFSSVATGAVVMGSSRGCRIRRRSPSRDAQAHSYWRLSGIFNNVPTLSQFFMGSARDFKIPESVLFPVKG
jgi:hypothetical protein